MRSRSLPTSLRLASLLAGLLLCASAADAKRPSPVSITPPVYESAPGSPAALVARHRTGTVFFSNSGLTIALESGQAVQWGPAELDRAPVAAQPLPGVVHELVGPQRRHRSALKAFGAVRYPDVAGGTELLVESKPGGYAWSLHAPSAAAAGEVVLRYSGVERLSIDVERSLLVAELEGAELRETGLACSQPLADGSTRPVRCLYGPAVRSGQRQWDYTVRLLDADPALPLIIDPSVTWAARAGGNNDDRANAVSFDETNRLVLVAASVASSNFPGPTAQTNDVALIRLREGGDAFESITYLGGNKLDAARDLLVGPLSRLYVAGITASSDLPATGAFGAAYAGGVAPDAFVCVLAADASTIERCTYLGGTGFEDVGKLAYSSIAGLFVTGTTDSASFHGASSLPAGRNVFVVGLTDLLDGSSKRLVLGGSGEDQGLALAADNNGYVYVGGFTSSAPFAASLPGLQQAAGGGTDGFVARVNAITGTLAAWTYLAGTGSDAVRALAVPGGTGALYALGDTDSSTGAGDLDGKWPVKGTTFDTTVGKRDLFLTRLQPDLVDITWSMLLGGADDEQAAALAVDAAGSRLYLAGNRLGDEGGLHDDLPGLNYFDALNEGPSEVVLAAVQTDATFVWSSYFGGAGAEEALAISVRPDHTLHLAGVTIGAGFPVSGGGLDAPSSGSDEDLFVAAIPGDTSAPLAGTVGDGPPSAEELDEQSDPTTLAAHWRDFSDPESGIAKFEAGLGTSPADADLVPFTDVAESDQHTFSGLTLETGKTYFVLVRATNGAGDTVVAASDGITIVAQPDAGTTPGTDAGAEPDAGAAPDGGTGPEPDEVVPGPVLGWRCAAAGAGGATPGLLLVLASALLARRRRS